MLKGFTLLELVVVMGIIAITLVFAIPPAQQFLNKNALKRDAQLVAGFFQEGRSTAKRSECAIQIQVQQQVDRVSLNMALDSEPTVECEQWQNEVGDATSINQFAISLSRTQLQITDGGAQNLGYRVKGEHGLISDANAGSARSFSLAKGVGNSKVTASFTLSPEGISDISYGAGQ